MPASRMRVEPIWIWSPSRIFGTPLISAASAIAGSNSNATAKTDFMSMQGRFKTGESQPAIGECGVDRTATLVPTFRSSYTISAVTFYELRKAMGTSKFMILVPLFDLKSLGSFRRLRCRDFKSTALVPTFRSSYTISAITFYELRKAMGTSKFMILVPLFDLKSLGSFRRLRYRDFTWSGLGPTFRSSYSISAITFYELR